jgi:hypothetical protein
VKSQPYALIISGNIGQYPYTPPKRSYTLYLIAGILMMILFGGCILCCVCVMNRRQAQAKGTKKVGARMDDDDDEEDEETQREDFSDKKMKSNLQKEGRSSAPSSHQPTPGPKKNMNKKIHPENIQLRL